MPDDDGLTDVEYAAWRGFLEAHRRVMDVLEDELRADQDLPLSWYDVLVQLSESPDGSLRMQNLAQAVLLSKSGLTRLIDRMQADGLVARAPCPDDGRGVVATLTAAGRDRLRTAAPTHVKGVRQHFVDHLDADEAAVIGQVLGRIADAASPDAR